jgi:hypothetical protein
MRRPTTLVLLTAASIATTLAVASTATAINSYNARPTDHTEVGAFFALWDSDDEDGLVDRFDWVCSGAMIDDDTFLTAAHCTDDWPEGTTFYVSLEEDVQTLLDDAVDAGSTATEIRDLFVAEGWAVEGDTDQHPLYPGTGSNSYDIGVIDFSTRDVDPQDVWDFTPSPLPTPGLLDELGGRVLDTLEWTVVGYGLEEAHTGAGGQTFPGGGVRLEATLGFNALNATWVRLAMNEPREFGGACYGDSGGPNYVEIDGVDVLVGITVTGDVPCFATNVVYRTDTESARDFLAQYVDLPE